MEFLKAPFLVLHFSYHTLIIYICNIAIYADDTTLCSKYDQCDLWEQLELASELESDIWDTVDRDRKWLIDFNAGKNSTGFVWAM